CQLPDPRHQAAAPQRPRLSGRTGEGRYSHSDHLHDGPRRYPDDGQGDEARVLSGLHARFATLTPREREVMALVTAGRMNKQIAAEIGIAEITVKIHRGHIMRKMTAKSLPDLVRMAEMLGIGPAAGGPQT